MNHSVKKTPVNKTQVTKTGAPVNSIINTGKKHKPKRLT